MGVVLHHTVQGCLFGPLDRFCTPLSILLSPYMVVVRLSLVSRMVIQGANAVGPLRAGIA